MYVSNIRLELYERVNHSLLKRDASRQSKLKRRAIQLNIVAAISVLKWTMWWSECTPAVPLANELRDDSRMLYTPDTDRNWRTAGGAAKRTMQCEAVLSSALAFTTIVSATVRRSGCPSHRFLSRSLSALRPLRWITRFDRQSLRKVHFQPEANLRSNVAAAAPATLYMTIAMSPGRALAAILSCDSIFTSPCCYNITQKWKLIIPR